MFQSGLLGEMGRLRLPGFLSGLDRRQLLHRFGGLGALAFGLSGCDARHTISANVKLTFTLKVGGRFIHRAGIWKISYAKASMFPNPGFGYYWTLIGDAICIYASDAVTIFATMMSARGDLIPSTIRNLEQWNCSAALEAGYGVSLDWVGDDCPGLRQLIADAPTQSVPVPVSGFPVIVAFTDPRRAETGSALDPRDNLARLGAADVRVDRLEIQLVNEPVDRSAAAHLPWLGSSRRNGPLDPPWTDFARHPEYFSR